MIANYDQEIEKKYHPENFEENSAEDIDKTLEKK